MQTPPSRFFLAPQGVRFWGAICCLALSVIAAWAGDPIEDALVLSVSPTVTNIDQILNGFPGLANRALCPVRLSATVLLGGKAGSVVMLEGSSALAFLGSTETVLERGDLVTVTGDAVRDGTNLWFGVDRFIDNDGSHSMFKKSAGAWLEAGDYPVRVDYFNFIGSRGLKLSLAGPQMPNAPIPNASLFHVETNAATHLTSEASGLAYACYNGEWIVMPDLDRLEPYRAGVCANFDITLSGKEESYAMRFNGRLRIPLTGYYTFTCESDDGSILSLSGRPVVAQITGHAELPPLAALSPGQTLASGSNHFCVSLDGTVTFASTQAADPVVELTGGRGHATIQLLRGNRDLVDMLTGCRVRVAGICDRVYAADGAPVAGRLTCPSGDQFYVREFASAARQAPVLSLEAALAESRANGPRLMRIFGLLEGNADGSVWQLRDGAASVPLVEVFGCPYAEGQHVEFYGSFTPGETNQPGLLGLCRAVDPTAADRAVTSLPVVTAIEEVKQMTREQAKRGYPAKVRGVITFVWPDGGFFLQDGTRSVEVRMAPGAASDVPRLGDYWEAEGETFAEFAPDILARRAARLGQGVFPEPVRPSWQQLIDGSLDTQYVEVQGVVSRVAGQAVSLLTRGGRLTVQLPELSPADLASRRDALVKIRGCLIPGRDVKTQQVKIGEFALRSASFAIERPAPADPFALALKRAADLLLFESHASPIEPVRLRGSFLQQWDGACFFLDGVTGVRVESASSTAELRRGDSVDIVGYPDFNGPSLRLRDAVMRRAGASPLPPPTSLAPDRLMSDDLDSTLVEARGVLVSRRMAEGDQILEMRTGSRLWLARFPANGGALPSPPLGSELSLHGVYVGLGGDRPAGRPIDSFQILLSVPSDVAILRQPSWWTPRHTLALAATLLAVLCLAAFWIWMLRRRVEQRTEALKNEIEDHKRTELRLQEKTTLLTLEIEERVRMQAEIDRGHRQLLITSRRAGMAEVATSVLHNVGNVLTNVNVLGASISEQVRNSKIVNVARLGGLLVQHKTRLDEFVRDDERGRKVPDFVAHLGARLEQEQGDLIELVSALNENIEHINEIVATQQSYAKISGVLESVSPEEVIEDALRMHGESLKRHGVTLRRKYAVVPPITMDRHKVLQILFNLLENAKHACMQAGGPDRAVIASLEQTGGLIRIAVADNGIGISPSIIGRIFSQGFSTRRDGHGFGLHSSVLAAEDMGGSLTAESDGPGKGALFVLSLPLHPPPHATAQRAAFAAELSPS